MSIKISVIVLNYNSWQDTLECLESVFRSNYGNYQVIVVDNNSPNKSMDYIKAWAEGSLIARPTPDNLLPSRPPIARPIPYVYYSREQAEMSDGSSKERQYEYVSTNNNGALSGRYPLILIQSESNKGFAGGNNIGIRYAIKRGSDYILILNNDTVVTQNFISEMVVDALNNPQVGMIAPRIFKYHNPDVIDRLGIVIVKSGFSYDRKYDGDGPLLCPSGCAALYSRAMLNATAFNGEYFDEDFFMYCEDSDLGLRAQLKGFGAVLSDKAVVFHKGGGSPGTYYIHRNTIWVVIKDFPLNLLFKNFFWILSVQVIGYVKAILNYRKRKMVLKGKIDGIKGIRRTCKKRIRYNTYNLPIDERPFIRNR